MLHRVLPLFALLTALSNNCQAQWTQLCAGQTTNGTFVDFAEFEGQLYATGFFTKICNQNAKYIARWNNGSWTAVGSGLSDAGHALAVIDNELYVAKYELGIDSNWLYRWNGATFQKMGHGVWRTNPNPNNQQTPSIYDVIKFQDQLVICGEFNRASGKAISGIARWNGTAWDSLGSGLSGNIAGQAPVLYPHQMLLFNNELIVAGNFGKAGGKTVNGIARWDGTQWAPMGTGFNNTVYGIGVLNGELYAGGAFTQSGTTPLNRIAKWNGSVWVDAGISFPDGGPNDYIFVHTLENINGKLYVSGGLKKVLVAGVASDCGGIVAFDGTSVDLLAGGVANNDIEAIASFSDGIIAGGGVFGTGYIATWSGPVPTLEASQQRPLVRLYPNPATQAFAIELNAPLNGQYSCYNATGQCIKAGVILDGKANADTEKWATGIYCVKVMAQGMVFTQRLIVQRI